MSSRTPTTAVVIVTYNRPEHVQTCLEHLASQSLRADEILVVDSSPHLKTKDVVELFPEVRYMRNELGIGYMATSRALGVEATTSDIVAFIDDDAFAEPDWLNNLVIPYADPSVGAVGGRARNGRKGEEQEGIDKVGLLLPNGELTGYFAALTSGPRVVDHLIGCNMSYRRTALDQIGGIHDHWPGTSLREDADTGLRIQAAGFKVVYTPDAVVLHVGGTYARGRRFDLRYAYYGARNHSVLLAHALGVNDVRTRRYRKTARQQAFSQVRYSGEALRDPARSPAAKARGAANGIVRAAIITVGTLVGRAAGYKVRRGTEHAATPHLTKQSKTR